MGKWSEELWETRYKTLGDPAENRFREWAAQDELSYHRYGLDRPPLDLSRVPAFVRYTPDFLTSRCLIEVQGCGRDSTFKFKHDKLSALEEWYSQFPVKLFLWNKTSDQIWLVDVMKDLYPIVSTETSGLGWPTLWRTDGMFDGNKPYAGVHCGELGHALQ
jgi:hypothetical protein